ncbi:MAG: peptidoglycan DD-metalloendopeptidase family protein [Minisyncoccia bacterium]
MRHFGFPLFILLLCAAGLLGTPRFARADAASDLQAQIDANNSQMASLQADIAAYQKQLDALGAQKSTLQSTINTLAISQKQLAKQMQVTQNKVATANLQVQQLTFSIGDTQQTIGADQNTIAKALRDIDQGEQMPLFMQLISSNSLSDAWNAADQTLQFNQALGNHIDSLHTEQMQLASNRDAISVEEAQLVALQNQLTTQKRSVDATTAAQKQLLTQTKNQESNYQKLITQKEASEKSFEQQLINLQSQLKLVVNPSSLPKTGTGVLSWPFSTAFMANCGQRQKVFGNLFCITQYFGNTDFSTANPQVYNGHGHDGVDISAPIGTPVQAALAGTVLATGNTDLAHDAAGNQCYSFGKWVMLTHGNGINTMYAHLSEIDVSKGQSVATGQVIGLSGMTGYATGPHLHFGVYATDGTEIQTLQQFRGATTPCGGATMPVATLSAYLNPLSYL